MSEENKNEGAELANSIAEMFTFTKTNNEKLNDNLKAFSSMAYLLAQMVVKTESRKAEGSESIRYLELAFLYYKESQIRKPIEEREEKSNIVTV